jgi:hypothetical protein
MPLSYDRSVIRLRTWRAAKIKLEASKKCNARDRLEEQRPREKVENVKDKIIKDGKWKEDEAWVMGMDGRVGGGGAGRSRARLKS